MSGLKCEGALEESGSSYREADQLSVTSHLVHRWALPAMSALKQNQIEPLGLDQGNDNCAAFLNCLEVAKVKEPLQGKGVSRYGASLPCSAQVDRTTERCLRKRERSITTSSL